MLGLGQSQVTTVEFFYNVKARLGFNVTATGVCYNVRVRLGLGYYQ